MNKRIEELSLQCIRYKLIAEGARSDFDYKKFAELIVRECIDKCEFVANMATITNTGEMARKTKATADSCATMIKEHFGVEE